MKARTITIVMNNIWVGHQKLVNTAKRHFYACEKFIRIRQNGPLEKFMRFLFMRSSVQCIVTYGPIKIYAVQIYATGT